MKIIYTVILIIGLATIAYLFKMGHTEQMAGKIFAAVAFGFTVSAIMNLFKKNTA